MFSDNFIAGLESGLSKTASNELLARILTWRPKIPGTRFTFSPNRYLDARGTMARIVDTAAGKSSPLGGASGIDRFFATELDALAEISGAKSLGQLERVLNRVGKRKEIVEGGSGLGGWYGKVQSNPIFAYMTGSGDDIMDRWIGPMAMQGRAANAGKGLSYTENKLVKALQEEGKSVRRRDLAKNTILGGAALAAGGYGASKLKDAYDKNQERNRLLEELLSSREGQQ